MTDNQSTIAGNYKGTGPVIEVILDEGAPTLKNSMAQNGMTLKTLSWASELEENQVVAISNDTANTYAATEGMPVMEKAVNTETLVIGTIVSTPQNKAFPATDAAADTLAERLAGKYYRTALVELHIPGKVVAAQVMANGANATVPGVGTTLNANITKMYTTTYDGYFFDSAAANGTGVIPFHYVPAGVDGDLYTCLCLVYGLLYAVTGA
ncbi:MAG: hypothetical protein Q8R70_04985 [Methanoregula sp.]|nr:hypothetical protein [Methanoregula sp.]